MTKSTGCYKNDNVILTPVKRSNNTCSKYYVDGQRLIGIGHSLRIGRVTGVDSGPAGIHWRPVHVLTPRTHVRVPAVKLLHKKEKNTAKKF